MTHHAISHTPTTGGYAPAEPDPYDLTAPNPDLPGLMAETGHALQADDGGPDVVPAAVEDYLYVGAPLTPAVMRHLIPMVVRVGEVLERRELVRRVMELHHQRHGVPGTTNPAQQMKKCLQGLQETGHMQLLPTHGHWRHLGTPDPEPEPDQSAQGDCVDDDVPLAPPDHESGTGTGAVYIYYFPTFYHPHDPFPLKVGMTHGCVTTRILTQLGTGHPEYPHLHRIHHTDHPGDVERYLHLTLKLQGLRKTDAPGAEWFTTRPEHIDTLLTAIGHL